MNRTILTVTGVFSASSLLLVDSAVKGTVLLALAAVVTMILRRRCDVGRRANEWSARGVGAGAERGGASHRHGAQSEAARAESGTSPRDGPVADVATGLGEGE